MSAKQAKPNEHIFSGKRVLPITLLFLVYVLISQIILLFNVKTPSSNITFDKETDCYYIGDELDRDTSINLDEHWIFFPNITNLNITSHIFDSRNYDAYPRAENASIQPFYGWNNFGNNVTWYFSTSNPVLAELKGDDGELYNSCAYLVKLKFPDGTHSFNMNLPKIEGTADIYCNGSHVSRLSENNSIASWIIVPKSIENIPLETDSNGCATIIIVVSAKVGTFSPGILSMPTLSGRQYEITNIILPSMWLAITISAILISIIGGAIVSRTFKYKGKFYYLLFTELVLTIYTIFDYGVIDLETPILNLSKYALVIILGIITYGTFNSYFDKDNSFKLPLILKYDFVINAVIGIILALLPVFNRSLLTSNYLSNSARLFTLIGTLICLMKIIIIYNRDRNSVIIFNIYITVLFIFMNMFNYATPIVDIKPYLCYAIIGLTALEICFILRYVQQFFELRNASERLTYLVKEKTLYISEINRDLYNTNKRLLENEEARKNVLSNVSHDLRTPITAIRGYAELLLTSGKTMKEEQVHLYLQNIVKRSQQMERIVSDIVELTRMESNKDEFKFNDIALAELLDELYMMYDGEVRGTSKRITLDIPEDDLLIVKADYKKISRVFENLISNSINYTYDDALIQIKAWREGKELPLSDQRIHITIEDNGIGIPEEEVNKVFDRFYRAKNSGKNIKGTGLGLSIVYTIIKHHDADITVQSQLGSGTTFHIVMKATY